MVCEFHPEKINNCQRLKHCEPFNRARIVSIVIKYFRNRAYKILFLTLSLFLTTHSTK